MVYTQPSLAHQETLGDRDTTVDGNRNSTKHNTCTHRSHHNSYPYTRQDECSWQPDDVARHMSLLLSSSSLSSSSMLQTGNPNNGTTPTGGQPQQLLLSQGLSNSQVLQMRRLYGINRVANDKNDDDDEVTLALLSETTTSATSKTTTGRRRHNDSYHPYSIFRRMKRNIRRFIRTTIRPIMEALLGQIQEPLILMLLGSAILSIMLGNPSDAISIAIALFIVSMVAAIQEYRSERALEQLQHLVPNTCTVVRNHGTIYPNSAAQELVIGDLLLLQTGDRIPADCRIVDSVELTVDESALTGEPDAISKTSSGMLFPQSPLYKVNRTNSNTSTSSSIGNNSTTSHSHISLNDQQNIVFAGTLVSGGRGRAIVIAVGARTEFGKIATALTDITTMKSPLQMKIDELSQRLAYISTIVILLIALLGYILGRPILETLTIAVSLAVAAIPEGLPICVTVTLALGVLRMAKQNAIIASDKTGTLTQNESTFVGSFIVVASRSLYLTIRLVRTNSLTHVSIILTLILFSKL
jgi:magnesium-transporting ATPase (P-type)